MARLAVGETDAVTYDDIAAIFLVPLEEPIDEPDVDGNAGTTAPRCARADRHAGLVVACRRASG